MRLRWKKDKAETGLARIGAAPRGHTLHDGEKEYAHVSPLGGGWRELRGWFWSCPTSAVGEYANTCNDPAPDVETAKAQAMAFVKARLPPNAQDSSSPPDGMPPIRRTKKPL